MAIFYYLNEILNVEVGRDGLADVQDHIDGARGLSFTDVINRATDLVKIPKSNNANPRLGNDEIVFCMNRVSMHPPANSARFFEHCVGHLMIKVKNEEKRSTLKLTWEPISNNEKYFEADLDKVRSIKILYENKKVGSGQLAIMGYDSDYKIFHFYNGGLDHLERAFEPWGFIQAKRHKSRKDATSISTSVEYHVLSHYSVVQAFQQDMEFHPNENIFAPVSWKALKKMQDAHGRIIDSDTLEKMLFFAGMDPNVRSEMWPYLLGCHDYRATSEEKRNARKQKVMEYENILQCKQNLTEQQRELFYEMHGCIIERDVLRTDRNHPYFLGEKNPNVQVLKEILEIYALLHPHIGYVQGMSDLLSPILYVMRDRVDALWCFEGAMSKSIFMQCHKSVNLDVQEKMLKELVRLLMPYYYRHSVTLATGRQFSYCFRWLILNFKREFQEEDFFKIWEACWSMHETANFNVFLCAAVLCIYGSDAVAQNFGIEEMVMHFNSLSMNMNIHFVLKKARSLLYEFKNLQFIPCTLSNLCRLHKPNLWKVKVHQIIECTGHPDGEECLISCQ